MSEEETNKRKATSGGRKGPTQRKRTNIKKPPANAIIDFFVLQNVNILMDVLSLVPLASVFSFMHSCKQAYEVIKQKTDFWSNVWQNYPFWHSKADARRSYLDCTFIQRSSYFEPARDLLASDRAWLSKKGKFEFSLLHRYEFDVHDIFVNEGRLASSAKDFRVHIFNLADRSSVQINYGGSEPYLLVRLQGDLLAFAPSQAVGGGGTEQNYIKIMDLNTQDVIFRAPCLISKSLALEGNILLDSQAREMTAYDIRTHKIVKTFPIHDFYQSHIQFDGQKILSCTQFIELFDFRTGADLLLKTLIQNCTHPVAYFNDRWVVCKTSEGSTIFRYDINTGGHCTTIYNNKSARVNNFKMDGNKLVATEPKALCFYDVNKASLERRIPLKEWVKLLDFDDAGLYCARNKEIYTHFF
eukprot:Phypoly_transcript_09526.p1 GENE.Phypoly_transcript_09526~~Phypoly_transcript_09526.p1  ORF type:complete len:413 (+),score=45.71 Phypoly_transcript_09526:123-1361(+)